jgi:hypothetical protein
VRVLKNKTAKVVAEALQEIIAKAGVASTFKIDNGLEFIVATLRQYVVSLALST